MKLRMRSQPKRRPRATSVTFSAEDLTALAGLLAAGQVMLQRSAPVVSRLKAAMTRLGVTVPKGL